MTARGGESGVANRERRKEDLGMELDRLPTRDSPPLSSRPVHFSKPLPPRSNMRRLIPLLALATAPLHAQAAPPDWKHAAATGDFTMRDFHFADGESLPALRIHYATLGRPQRDGAGHVRNAVLVLHGTTGSGDGFLTPSFAGELFGPGQPLDSATHFIILPDGIGTGRSSRPSEGMHARFPRYGYADMVEAQHRLVTEGLHVDHLRLVIGTSMGGMQTWMWGERWPAMMDALVPLASVPTQIAGRNRMMRRMVSDAIRGDPEWNGGDYAAAPHGLYAALEMLFMMTSSPLTQQHLAPTRDSADAYITRWMRARMATTDANDFLYQFEASGDYDPSAALERITAPVLAISSADDLVNPPELGLMEALMPRVRHGRYVLIPTSERTRGHGTHSLPAIWKPYLIELLAGLRRTAAR